MLEDGDFILALKTISLSRKGGRKPQTLLTAMRHIRREIQAELGASGHIDPARMALNETLVGHGTAAAVVARADRILAAAGVDVAKLRKDRVQAIELLFSIPANADVDPSDYFHRCWRWLAVAFPTSPLLSFDIHLDEAHPHAHAMLLPLEGGKYAGSSLTAKSRLRDINESFFTKVAGPAGFRRPGARLRGDAKAAAVRAVLDTLQRMDAPELRGPLWPITKVGIEAAPERYFALLNIHRDALKPSRTVETIGFESAAMNTSLTTQNTSQHAASNHVAKHRNLSCVGFASPITVSEADSGGRYIRFTPLHSTMFTDLLNVAKKPSSDDFNFIH